jgi:chorismate mutase / prephenate dehydratase
MSTPAAQDISLDDIRREIDAIDDGILDLLARRIQASEQVRNHKSNNGALSTSPIRPAREAAIMRRLLARGGSAVPPELLVRLWRAILTSSTLTQAPVTIHIARKLSGSIGLRLRLRDHFGAMPVEEHRDEAQALVQVNVNPGDICVVEVESTWADAFAEGKAGEARVISVLPPLREAEPPKLLVFGHAQAMATGDDETLVVSNGKLPRDFTPLPLWQIKSGSRRVSCLPGFLPEREGSLVSLIRSNAALGLKVAGQFPSPIEVKS